MTNASITPGSILVGVDGSVHGEIALQWAATYAEEHGQPLALVHAAETVVGVTVNPAGHDASLAAGHEVMAAARRLVEKAHPSLDLTSIVAETDPRALLLEAAVDASLLVVGSRGHGAVASLLLGSVSVALAGHAPCPVVVARPLPDSVPAEDLTVVVGVDGSPDDAEAITLAFELASARLRPLEVVHAVGLPTVYPFPDVLGTEVVQDADEDWDLLIAETLTGYAEKYPDVVVHRRIVKDSSAHALVDASAHAAVVVVGSRSQGAHEHFRIASVSRSVVEHAHSTVVVVRGAPS